MLRLFLHLSSFKNFRPSKLSETPLAIIAYPVIVVRLASCTISKKQDSYSSIAKLDQWATIGIYMANGKGACPRLYTRSARRQVLELSARTLCLHLLRRRSLVSTYIYISSSLQAFWWVGREVATHSHFTINIAKWG